MVKKQPIVVVIDGPNSVNLDVDCVMRAVNTEGEVRLAKAFGDWTNWRYMDSLAWELLRWNVELVHVPSVFSNGNKAKLLCDEALMSWLLSFFDRSSGYNPLSRRVKKVCLVAGDAHYIPTVLTCQRKGKEVVIIFSDGASARLKQMANKFVAVPAKLVVPQLVPCQTEEVQLACQRAS